MNILSKITIQEVFRLAKLETISKTNHISTGTLYFVTEQGQVKKIFSTTKNQFWDLGSIQKKTKVFSFDFSGIVKMIERSN